MRVVAAPNPFKGSLGAPAAAHVIALGVRDVCPGAEVVEVPVADGGEGTVEALVAARGGELVTVTVEGPLGDPVAATYGVLDATTAVVELAASSGLPLVPPERRDPRRASTYGFGQLLEAARRRGARRIIAGVGGSATNDGGAGMAQALGFRLLDAEGRDLPRGGAALARLARIDAGGVDPAWRQVEVEVAVDVTNPLTGPEGASAVYGPQKGAGPEVVAELDAALDRFAQLIGRAVADLPGAGAAGGTAAGLVYFLGAKLRRGAPLVVEAAGLERALAGARAVFTGEGRVDRQTAYGKGPVEVARRARAAGATVVLLAGSRGPGWEAVLEHGVAWVESLVEEGTVSPGEAEVRAAELLRAAAARACRRLFPGPGGGPGDEVPPIAPRPG
ncbi:MAG TPA: glycerate kinase [Candidatus Dormibacteraeota bacterium]|nr:glycerate kinase [Candidatus Dormibacteraeota bacterium]